ncbi:uncharacterized protein RJT21DRAFT_4988 [Scheffersomyces amazonensis]|uniref:uncharacterized protein n=1 Tax=Scheffersomyces amazonensis TaxID=1078765 RepID=UPI00315C6CE5
MSESQDNKEFGQLGDVIKEATGGDSSSSGVQGAAADNIAKFEKLSDKDKEDLAKGALGKVEKKTQEDNKQEEVGSIEIPSAEELQSIAKRILNPHGENPQMDEFISGAFSYISQVMLKMSTTTNREETAKEIAQDLTTKFEAWIKSREANPEESNQEPHN